MKYYLAVDIGATSGRHIIGYKENGKIRIEEIYRFDNGVKEKDGHLIWDVDKLFNHILEGMKECQKRNIIPESIGIDTWAVDYVLIDSEGKRLHDAISYRDNRTDGKDQEIYKLITEDDLYKRNGIQKQLFNTIYQLKCEDRLNEADCLLMIPDYFNYLLTGRKYCEYTNASTTQLVSAKTKKWDYELINTLNYPENIFPEIKTPGFHIGNLRKEIVDIVGYDTKVVMPPEHDTASAVVAVPNNEDTIYISSGTWSLIGVENTEAKLDLESQSFNFTSEGGFEYRFRYLKNIMGMWMINSIRKEICPDLSFDEIVKQARSADIESYVDASLDEFRAPESMKDAIDNCCVRTDQKVPSNISEYAKLIYKSLALSYKKSIAEIEKINNKKYESINIVGGGSKNIYLNELTSEYCNKTVYYGPSEATAIGNIAIQMLSNNEFNNLKEIRECIYDSFDVKKIERGNKC